MADIAKLRELLAKATPGPWEACNQPTGGCICGGVFSNADDGVGVAGCGSILEDLYADHREDDSERIRANAVLIAEAITALPDLLAIAEGAEADRADAKRYRFIRAGKSRGDVDLCVCKADWKYHSRAILCDDEADAAIDAALAGGEGVAE